MTRLVSISDRLRSSLQYTCKKTAYTFTNSNYYDLPAIIFPQPYQIDFDTINEKASNLYDMAYDAFDVLKEYLLPDLELMEEKFLEWDGSRFGFQQFLSDCIREATAAQQNSSSDGSGDADLDLSSNIQPLYVPPECKKKIQNQADIWNDKIFSPDFHQYKLQYRGTVENIFENSTKSPDAFDQHKACMYVLGSKTVQQAYLEFYIGIQNVTKAQRLEDYNLATNKMLISVKELIVVRDNLTMCDWMRDIIQLIFYQQTLDQKHSLQRMNILRNSLEIMSKTMASMDQAFELHGKPILNMITAYMKENVTKIELARHMHSPRTTYAIEELAEFESNLNIVIKSLQV